MDSITHIINADDFGRNSNVNAAILHSFQNGWVSSATIMANMPGFDNACQLAHQEKLVEKIGLHIVLTEGYPLTEKIRNQPLFCDNSGRFKLNRNKRVLWLNKDQKKALAEEIRAQVNRCRDNGIPITHVDSHHHIHEEIGVISVIISLMREFGIPYIRIMCNTAELCSIHRRFYAMLYNGYLKYRGLNRTYYFGSIDQYIAFKKKYPKNITKKIFDIMIHPILNDEGVIVDSLNKKPIKQLIDDARLRRKARSFSGAIYDSHG